MTLEDIGFTTWFQDQVDSGKLDKLRIARVISVHKDGFFVTDGESEQAVEVAGRLMYLAESPLDYPTVGDWCYVLWGDDESSGIIQEVFQRKSLLKRKVPGKRVKYQLVAANIDKAFIIQSLDDDYNLKRLERYLALVNESDIAPIILLSKRDLLPEEEVAEKMAEIDEAMRVPVLAFSNEDKSGLDAVKDQLSPGETLCLLGSSGVGKTTLLNQFLGEDLFATKAVRAQDGKGRHTTSHRQLVRLANGGMIVDVPGMRELANIGIETGLDETFHEITELAAQCHFRDCSHTQEKGCAVLVAVEEGVIPQRRYQNYLKMSKESEFHQASYAQKRHKGKKLRKMIKSVQRNHYKYKK